MVLVAAKRLEPKKVFRCVECSPRVYRRYWFCLENDRGETGEYCLPCASRVLDRSQGDLRRMADSAGEGKR